MRTYYYSLRGTKPTIHQKAYFLTEDSLLLSLHCWPGGQPLASERASACSLVRHFLLLARPSCQRNHRRAAPRRAVSDGRGGELGARTARGTDRSIDRSVDRTTQVTNLLITVMATSVDASYPTLSFTHQEVIASDERRQGT